MGMSLGYFLRLLAQALRECVFDYLFLDILRVAIQQGQTRSFLYYIRYNWSQYRDVKLRPSLFSRLKSHICRHPFCDMG